METEVHLASYIEHTNLKQTASEADIERLCREAREWGFAAVCVAPYFVERAKRELEGSGVELCTVIGFPLGYTYAEVKVAEAERAFSLGADHIDVVINVSAAKSGHWQVIEGEVGALVDVARAHQGIIKVILETSRWEEADIRKLCRKCVDLGVDYLKTSTGFDGQRATVEAVRVLRSCAGEAAKVKAAGGIRTREDALKMIEAGADRIGTSSGVAIIRAV